MNLRVASRLIGIGLLPVGIDIANAIGAAQRTESVFFRSTTEHPA